MLTEPASTSVSAPRRAPTARPRHAVRPAPVLHRPAALAAVVVAVRIGVGVALERIALAVFPERGFPLAVPGPHATVRDGFFSWDAAYYKLIAATGYPSTSPARTPFFPLYPALIRLVEDVTGLGYDAAALAVSWLALFVACWGLIRLARIVTPGGVAVRSAWALCWFPVSVFLIAGYAESLFVALFAWVLVLLAEDRPWPAAALACLAGLTRPEGALIGLAVLVWGLARPRRRLARTAATTALSELGFVGFSVFLWRRFGSPLAEFHVQRLWHRQATWPLHTVVWSLGQVLGGHLHGPGSANTAAVFLVDDLAIVGAVAGVAYLAWRWRGRRDRWFVLAPTVALLVGVVSNGPYGVSPESAARYVLCLVPLYLLPTLLRRSWVWTAALVVTALSAVAFQVVFNLGGWLT